MVITPGLNVATRQGQDNPSIVDGIHVVAASLAKAAIAEDGKLLLFRPAFALRRRAAKQRFEFPGGVQPVRRQRLQKTGLWRLCRPPGESRDAARDWPSSPASWRAT